MAGLMALRVTVRGRVQGVFFCGFVLEVAEKLGVRGYVRNLPDRGVEIRAEGDVVCLESLVRNIQKGPPFSRVEKVTTAWSEYTGSFSDFTIKY